MLSNRNAEPLANPDGTGRLANDAALEHQLDEAVQAWVRELSKLLLRG